MDKHLKKISNLINAQHNLENETKFKIASASLICSVIDMNQINPDRYCSLFQKNLNLSEKEFEKIQNEISNDALNLEEKVSYVKSELNNNMFQIMEFLKILNQFAILNGCTQKSYREFELIRDRFLREFY